MIIAEMCHNHLGSWDTLSDMVKRSAEVGANFCKIQSFFSDDLSPAWAFDKVRVAASELSWADHQRFVELCKAEGTIPMTSVYTTRHLPKLNEIGMKWIKIGSAQARDEVLIKTYIAAGFHVIVSTGGHNHTELPRIGPLAAALHCVSKYPHSPYEANLMRMLTIQKWYGGSVAFGLSDHSDPTHEHWDKPATLALAMGATYVEKHVTILDRFATKDGAVSITIDQLRSLCAFDRMETGERLERHPAIGLFVHAQDPKERALIQRYETRWAS